MAVYGSTDAILKYLVELSNEATGPLVPQWEGRKDIAKTIISLASATLVFTMTFSSSLIRPGASTLSRYSLIVCWLCFVVSLILCLIFLWLSTGLTDLPALIMARTDKVKQAIEERLLQTDDANDPIYNVFKEAFDVIARRDKRARNVFIVSLVFFGVALLIFTVLGVRQLAFS